MAVPMALRRIIISDIHESQHIELREIGGGRRFTIVIGQFEAGRIDRKVKKLPSPRPLTHDLLVDAVGLLGGKLEALSITGLKDGVYFGHLRIRRPDGTAAELDCRPSDGVAVAVAASLPILVAEKVLEEAGA